MSLARSGTGLPAPLVAAIERCLREVLGGEVRVREVAHRSDFVSYRSDRTFWTVDAEYDVGTATGVLTLLAKCSPRYLGRRAIDRYLSTKDLPVPRYFGAVAADGIKAALWQYHPGRTAQTFDALTPDELERLMAAVARIAATTRGVEDEVSLPTGVRWAEPMAEQLGDVVDANPVLAKLRPEVEFLAAIEERAIERLNSMGPRVLIHNDLTASNVILGADGEIYIIDWDSASIGPPGASLRKFASGEPELEQAAASRYCRYLGQYGVAADFEDVLQVMRAQQVLWSLNTGLRRNRLKRIAWGLKRVRGAFGDMSPTAGGRQESTPRPAPESLKRAVRAFMKRNRGRLYSPIPHPDFEGWPSSRGNERFEVIEPHLRYREGTALDIGTHFGTFAHWLEDLGYRVTAVEKSAKYARAAREIRDLCGKRFTVITGSIFDLEGSTFDVVLALNIFHHFLKTRESFESLERFLDRLECKLMIFQAHVSSEDQMANAHRNMEQEEFARFVATRAGLPEIDVIGAEGPRKIFKLARSRQAC